MEATIISILLSGVFEEASMLPYFALTRKKGKKWNYELKNSGFQLVRLLSCYNRKIENGDRQIGSRLTNGLYKQQCNPTCGVWGGQDICAPYL